MANTASAHKCVRQDMKRRQHNASLRSRVRTAVKGVLKAVASGDRDAAHGKYRAASSLLDRGVAKNHLHKNKAARHKRNLHRRISNMS